jgi:molybdenum cofactor biosynthesis protein B
MDKQRNKPASGPFSHQAHRDEAAKDGPIAVAVVTVSDSRGESEDRNGPYLRRVIDEAGHRLVGYRVVPDEPEDVIAALDAMVDADARVILFNGGTGVSKRDNTFDALSSRLEKTLPGFGELFRMLSWEQVGAAAMLSRATAGTYRGSVVISTPGSPKAVQLAWEKLIEPELQHLAWEVGR